MRHQPRVLPEVSSLQKSNRVSRRDTARRTNKPKAVGLGTPKPMSELPCSGSLLWLLGKFETPCCHYCSYGCEDLHLVDKTPQKKR